VEVFAVGPEVLADTVQKSVQKERAHGIVMIYSHLVQVCGVRSQKGLSILLLELLQLSLLLSLLFSGLTQNTYSSLWRLLRSIWIGLSGTGMDSRRTVARTA